MCACGVKKHVSYQNLITGKSTKCRKCGNTDRMVKHGKCGTSVYASWAHMINRCIAPSNTDYKHYGGRGIKVCSRWRSFVNFLQDMGEPQKGMTLDRVDNNGDYKKSNCQWATRQQQATNTRVTINIRYKGKAKTLSEWARELQISKSSLYYKIKAKNMDPVKAITSLVR